MVWYGMVWYGTSTLFTLMHENTGQDSLKCYLHVKFGAFYPQASLVAIGLLGDKQNQISCVGGIKVIALWFECYFFHA